MIRGRCLIVAAVLFFPVQVLWAGPIWGEGGAGRLLWNAEVVTVSTVDRIQGQLDGETVRGLPMGPGDFEDVYRIKILDPSECGGAAFSASTDWLIVPAGANDFDTQLWLFDSAGLGLLGNDDVSAIVPQSFITFPATDTTGQTFPGPGIYYLAISGGDGVAGGGGGDDPTSTGAIFDFSDAPDAFQISGPDGPGSAAALSGWSATGFGDVGSYDILLTCAAGVPEPTTLTLLLPVLILGPRFRRR